MRCEPVITISEMTKTYRIGVGRARIREMTPPPFDRGLAKLFPNWWTRNCVDALQDVSFSIEKGTSVGIVGHNGAGKTTLLKLIAGVTAPTKGSIHVNGKIAALLDVVVGFHPELTGRENLGLLGGIYGLDRREIAAKAPDILAFAGISDMIDTPVKRYSAGMVARLGFATVTAMDVDTLLIDEVLAVGDASFQRKCIDWLETYRQDGGTLAFVSHNLGLVKSMTERVVWIDHGRVVDDGPTSEVLSRYARALERRDGAESVLTGSRRARKKGIKRSMVGTGQDRWGAGGTRIGEVHIEGPDALGSLTFTIEFEGTDLDGDLLCIGFVDESGHEVGAASSPAPTDAATIRCVMRPAPLRPGIYFPVVAVVSADGDVRDRWKLERAVVVESDRPDPLADLFGPAVIDAEWAAHTERDDAEVRSG
jgi:ABC-type polysaccharide/polyol phosphate transport system ATPase subunit